MYVKLISFGVAVAIAASGVFLIAAPATARDRPVVVTASPNVIARRIQYADLNLAATSGERMLNRRVGSAVRSLCDEVTEPQQGSARRPFALHSCTNEAWDQARPQISLAIERSREIAATGTTSIVAAAITIKLR